MRSTINEDNELNKSQTDIHGGRVTKYSKTYFTSNK